ncbi:MAG: hypothetical protein AB7G11_13655 [Phycisphaerales bacterium]
MTRSNRTRTHRPAFSGSDLFMACESRRLLAGDLMHELVYPEGYAHSGISEFVPITNTGDDSVEYELHARYEVGERDQLLAAGTIPGHTRGGVTINRAGDPASMLVRPDTPYALVLRTSRPVAATMSHYDFGTAIGESFTDDRSTDWTFAEGFKDDSWTRDFVILYNPNNQDVTVTLTAYTGNGGQISLTRTVGAQRRSGWNLNNEGAIPAGVFGVRVHASAPIIAALSHYEIVTGRGFGALGTTGGGATAGVVTTIEFDDHDEDHHRRGGGGGSGGGNDDGTPDQGPGDFPGGGTSFPANSYLTVLNTGAAAATVRFTFITHEDEAPLANNTRTIVVPAGSRGGLSIRDLGFGLDDEFGAVYQSDVPVTVTAAVYQGRDALGAEAATVAATQWGFGEGYMSRLRAGFEVTEDIYLFNPTGENVSVTIQFQFSNGQVVTVTKSLSRLELEDVKVHATPEILAMGEDVFYGVRVVATGTIVATMEHWDRSLGGGFATLGVPAGTVVPVSSVLSLP